MREIDLEEYKNILLEIMDCIHDFCEENDIHYYLLYGSMIGAVRHKGFIPWDDDIDIGMLRADYEKFCKCFNKQVRNRRFQLLSIDETPGYYLSFAKVADQNTVLEEEIADAINIGAYVDVFPLDSCPGDLGEAENFAKKPGMLRKILLAKSLKWRKGRALGKNLVVSVCRPLLAPFSRERLIRKIDAAASEFKDDAQSKYIGEIVLSTYGSRGIWLREWFGDGRLYEFEGREYYGPCDYDKFLTGVYGDYMKLPPADQQVAHHDFKVWMVEG